MFHCTDSYFFPEVMGQGICPIFKRPASQKEWQWWWDCWKVYEDQSGWWSKVGCGEVRGGLWPWQKWLENGRTMGALIIPTSNLPSIPRPAEWFIAPTILLPLSSHNQIHYLHTHTHTHGHFAWIHKFFTKTVGCGTSHKYTNIHNLTE